MPSVVFMLYYPGVIARRSAARQAAQNGDGADASCKSTVTPAIFWVAYVLAPVRHPGSDATGGVAGTFDHSLYGTI
jgi:hypothetical protein